MKASESPQAAQGKSLFPQPVKAQQALAFGTINIPLKVAGNPTCRYNVRASLTDPSGTNTSVNAFKDDGSTTQAEPAGCAFSGAQRSGQIVLGCEAGRSVQIRVAYTQTGPTGTTFSNGAVTSAGVYLPELGAGNNQFGLIPYSGAIPCQPNKDGTVMLLLIGVLDVANNATLPRGSQISVATITVDASY